MTTFAHTITFDDGEIVMLQAALELMIEHSSKQLEEGKGAPNWAHKTHAQEVLKRLYDDTLQTSGNNFY